MDNEYQRIIFAKLQELDKAVSQMLNRTSPETPTPRCREFEFTPGVFWPKKEKSGACYYHLIYSNIFNKSVYITDRRATATIISGCQSQPRQILRAIRRIEAATAWCLARAEGRKRMAEEILRQQKKYVETLELEVTFNALKK